MSDWSISDASGSDSDGPKSIVRRKERDFPDSPFDQFCQHVFEEHLTHPSNDPEFLSTASLRKRWDDLSNEEKEHWEAKFGRTVLEYLKDHDLPGLSGRPRRTWRFSSTRQSDQGSSTSRAPAQETERKAPEIVHRAEFHQLRTKTRYGRGVGKPGARYLTSVQHNDIMEMKITAKDEDSDNKSSIAFGVTTFLAPIMDIHQGSSDLDVNDPIRYLNGRPVNARAEAGEVITVKSQTIIAAVRAIAPDYPEFSFQGDELLAAEPFCVFLRFRDDFLTLRDNLIKGSGNSAADVTSQSQDKKDVDQETVSSPNSSTQQASHITMLYKFIDSRYLAAIEREKSRWQQPEATCTFEWSWLLFTPGTLVYGRTSDKASAPRAYLVECFQLGGLFHYDFGSEKPQVNPTWLESRESRSYQHRLGKIKVTLVYLTNDGRQWIPKRTSVVLMPFPGERPITDLNIFPCEYFDDPKGQIKERLITRGKRYHTLSSRGLYQYQGQTLSGTRRWLDGRVMVDSETYHHDLRLTARNDPRNHSGYNPRDHRIISNSSSSGSSDSEMKPTKRSIQRNSKPQRRRTRRRSIASNGEGDHLDLPFADNESSASGIAQPANNLEQITVSSKNAMNQYLHDAGVKADIEADSVYMICDRNMHAYVLDERQWVLLSVEGIKDCKYDTEMIHELQIDKDSKRMIQALANTYTITQSEGSNADDAKSLVTKPPGPWSSDFVPNKGRGQILLLHGKPGVGKTTAAECVAERTKRPLLSITCGDLGSESFLVWGELTRWLRLGALWNAVLLFDEADVFLEARKQGGDINRNSLVSVFLRALEYYQGLIFLTTNRVGTFDEAVVSRIHVILHFPDLSDDDRQRIWDTSFKRLKEERSDVVIDDSVRDQALRDPLIRSLSWNGREIRSAFNNMISLAEWDAQESGRRSKDGRVEIRREHLQQVANTSSSFKEYLRSLYGLSEASRVKLHGLRDDDFGAGLRK